MKKIQRLASIGAMAALTLSIAACSSEEEPAAADAGAGAEATTEAAPEETTEEATEEPSMEESSEAPAAGGDGVTEITDIFGPACDQVPTEGEGSAMGMIDDPVGTAASNNPLFSTLVTAVTAADLVDTLNSAEALTVFGPINSAFEAVPPADLEALLADPAALSNILTYHVVGERLDAEGLLAAGSVESLQGGMVEIAGDVEAGLTVNDANVVCGNVPTANATVFAIDSLLMPPAA